MHPPGLFLRPCDFFRVTLLLTVPCMEWRWRQPRRWHEFARLASGTQGECMAWGPSVGSSDSPFPGQPRLDSVSLGSQEPGKGCLCRAKSGSGAMWAVWALLPPKCCWPKGLLGARALGTESIAWPAGQETWTTAVNWQWISRPFNFHLFFPCFYKTIEWTPDYKSCANSQSFWIQPQRRLVWVLRNT